MTAIRRILVTIKEVNGKSLPAVLKAAQLARACGAQLELFHVLTAPLSADAKRVHEQGLASRKQDMKQKALRRLESIADRLRIHSIKVNVSAEWDYPSYEAIIRRARATKADLIIAALHGGHHHFPWLLRLTDWELVRQSPIPLLLVKNANPYRHPAVLAAIDPGHTHEKPLNLDKAILSIGKMLSLALRGTLHAVYAYPSYPLSLPAEGMDPGMLQSLQEQAERSAKFTCQAAVRSSRIARSRQYLMPRPPTAAIAEASRKCSSAIVVMGAISRSGFKRLLIGNTAEQILDDLSCDILIVKPAHFANRIPTALRGARLRMEIATDVLGY